MAENKKACLSHENVVFEDEAIYLSGHLYRNCTFRRCTMIVMGGLIGVEACKFEGCAWHLNFLVHDSDDWDNFLVHVGGMITRTLPRLKDAEPSSES